MTVAVGQILALMREVPRPPGGTPVRGASSESLERLERSTGISIPEELRQWWSVCDGDMAGPGGLYGVDPHDDFLAVSSIYELYPHWKDAHWIPIAGDGTGCHYVLDLNEGIVGFVDTAVDDTEVSWVGASGVLMFLYFLLQSELGEKRWPFQADHVLAIDKDLATYHGSWPLPWTDWLQDV